MNKFAIYTVCTGGYDNIKQPQCLDSRFDFILYTDTKERKNIGVWIVKTIDYENENKSRVSRYPKTHPEELLSEYAATLYMDASIQIISPWIYNRFVELYNSGVDIASVRHPERDCIYDEAYYVLYGPVGGWEKERTAIEWCHKIWQDGFPRHYGLYEAGLLFRRNNSKMRMIDELWWKCISENNHKRDQFSFTYALWTHSPKTNLFLPEDQNVRTSPYLQYVKHQAARINKEVIKSKGELLRYRCFNITTYWKNLSIKIWHSLYRKSHPYTRLVVLGWIFGLFCSPIILKNKILHKFRKE